MAEQDLSDQDLLSACLQGDPAAWNIFVDRYSKLIYWSIRKTLNSSAFGKRTDFLNEIFQGFFERLLEKEELKKLRDVSSVRKFISVMACHLTLDKIKGLSRLEKKTVSHSQTFSDRDEAGPFTLDSLPDTSEDPSLQAASKERGKLIEAVLRKLSVKERACVEMHYLDGYTHPHIGEILGFSENTVSTVIRRAKDKIRRGFAGQTLEDF